VSGSPASDRIPTRRPARGGPAHGMQNPEMITE